MLRGHCLCGQICFAAEDPPDWVAHCQCESCRPQTASPFTTFFGIADGRWRWSGAEPSIWRSSPWVERFFCPRCGCPAAWIWTDLVREPLLTAGRNCRRRERPLPAMGGPRCR